MFPGWLCQLSLPFGVCVSAEDMGERWSNRDVKLAGESFSNMKAAMVKLFWARSVKVDLMVGGESLLAGLTLAWADPERETPKGTCPLGHNLRKTCGDRVAFPVYF